ncbi:hypothetical protein QQG55_48790 [Brugia pahangi]
MGRISVSKCVFRKIVAFGSMEERRKVFLQAVQFIKKKKRKKRITRNRLKKNSKTCLKEASKENIQKSIQLSDILVSRSEKSTNIKSA